MNQRQFGAAPAVGFSLAAAFAWTIFDYFSIAWMGYITLVLCGIAGFYVLSWLVESAAILVGAIHDVRMDMWRNEIKCSDRDLILADQLKTMSSEALQVYSALASRPFNPNDPANEILTGFALLTRSFAVHYLASCGPVELTPIRAYSEGTRDRQRDQASELLNWLVTRGYVNHWGGNQRAQWMTPDSSRLAREALGLVPPSPTAETPSEVV